MRRNADQSNLDGLDSDDNMMDIDDELHSTDMVMVDQRANGGKPSLGPGMGTGRSVVSTQKDSYFNATSAQNDPLTSGLDGYFNSEMDQTPIQRKSRLSGTESKQTRKAFKNQTFSTKHDDDRFTTPHG